MVRDYGQAFVVTGPAFDAQQAARLNGRISIPTYLWKAIYVPGVGAAAYVARNDAMPSFAVMSITELAHFAGVAYGWGVWGAFPPFIVLLKPT